MLMYPRWTLESGSGACMRPHWAPPEPSRFASTVYEANKSSYTNYTQSDEDSTLSSEPRSSPEHYPEFYGADRKPVYIDRPLYPPPDYLGSYRSFPSSDALTFQCKWKDCGDVFSSLSSLSNHVTLRHANSGQDGLFYCGWEGCIRDCRGFNARYKMLVHVRTHTNEKPHCCSLCQKCFSRAENLKIHIRSHSGEKPYVCPFEGCNKAYSNSSDRFKHTRTHSVDKPYACKVPGCQKRYTDPSSLRKHVKTYKHFSLSSPETDTKNPSQSVDSDERSDANSPKKSETPDRIPANTRETVIEYNRNKDVKAYSEQHDELIERIPITSSHQSSPEISSKFDQPKNYESSTLFSPKDSKEPINITDSPLLYDTPRYINDIPLHQRIVYNPYPNILRVPAYQMSHEAFIRMYGAPRYGLESPYTHTRDPVYRRYFLDDIYYHPNATYSTDCNARNHIDRVDDLSSRNFSESLRNNLELSTIEDNRPLNLKRRCYSDNTFNIPKVCKIERKRNSSESLAEIQDTNVPLDLSKPSRNID